MLYLGDRIYNVFVCAFVVIATRTVLCLAKIEITSLTLQPYYIHVKGVTTKNSTAIYVSHPMNLSNYPPIGGTISDVQRLSRYIFSLGITGNCSSSIGGYRN